jgi:hypothetical protein
MTAASRDDERPSLELAPRRMLDGGAGDPERRLLASAQLDRVPSAARARVAAALGGVLEPRVAPGIEPHAPEPAPRAEPLSRFGTRAGLGLVGAGLVGAIVLSLGWRSAPGDDAGTAPAAPVAASSATPPAVEPAAPAELRDATPLVHDDRAELAPPPALAAPSHLASPPIPALHERATSPRRRAAPGRAEPAESGLLAEVRALEAVSAALAAEQAEPAARQLQVYRRRFPRGELAIEADVLAVQIAVARGDHVTARAGAERLLARPEAEHYRARVRSLLAGNERAPAAPRENDRPERSNDAAAHIRARR